MEKLLKAAWVSPQVGWNEVSGNRRSGATSVTQTDGDSDMVAVYMGTLGGGGPNKGKVTSTSTSWEKAALSDLTLKPDNSVPLPYIPSAL